MGKSYKYIVAGHLFEVILPENISAQDYLAPYAPFTTDSEDEPLFTLRLEYADDLKALQPGDVVVLLDEHGKEFRSIEFADWVERKMHTVNKRLVFIIGGPYGFAPKVYEAAQEKISLSKMTFSHQMIRLIFVEQLYRAMTILNNNPYHHE